MRRKSAQCTARTGQQCGTAGVISGSGRQLPVKSGLFEGGSSHQSVASLMYVYESFRGVRAANEGPSITI